MKRFILVFIAINALLTVSAIEPQRIYHAVAGAVQDTVLTIPAIPNSISSVLELRMEFPDRRFLRKQSGNIVFSWRDCNNRLWTADFALSTSGTDEILDNTYLSLRVNSDENEVPVSENKYYDIVTDINSEISLCLGMTGNEIVFIAGQNTLKAFETVCGCFNPASPIEIKISGKIEISSLVTEFQKDMKGELSTGLNREEIINMTGNYPQPAGIWKALDRDTDSRQALAGGRYTLAIVPAEDKPAFDIIYIDGAEVNSDEWNAGMRKGKLIPTPFKDHYDLIWYDSQMEPIEYDATASVEQNVILTLSFPLLKSTLRFVRQTQDSR